MASSPTHTLIEPYGGMLINLQAPAEILNARKAYASSLHSLQISERAVYDLELLAVGAFSPLDRFMGRDDYEHVLQTMRLANGAIFPVPITLTVDSTASIQLDQDIALRNAKNELLAIMTVEEAYTWDATEAAIQIFGTSDRHHPVVAEMFQWGRRCISGKIEILALPNHRDFRELRHTPTEVRERLRVLGGASVAAFPAYSPLHRAQEEAVKQAAQEVGAVLLLHAVVGMTRLGDVDHFARVRTYQTLTQTYFNADTHVLSLLPLASRMAGPREILWHAVIERNYGANALIVGHELGMPRLGPGSQSPLADPDAARDLVEQHCGELDMAVLPLKDLVYLPDEGRYAERSRIVGGARIASLSDAQMKDAYLSRGRQLPDWFTRPETAAILAQTYPPRYRQGACIWLTGLSGAGKSTISEFLTVLLLEHGRQCTVLDGDVVRTHLSKGLGFSKEDRDINIRRIGYVAAEIVRHGGLVLCAAVSPYRATRQDVRSMVGTDHFVEVFVDTPLEVCEERDVKGMYAKARRGEIKDFTGIDDPYEAPLNPEVTLNTVAYTPEENARAILDYLMQRGFVVGVEGAGGN